MKLQWSKICLRMVVIAAGWLACGVWAVELPGDLIEGLKAESFKDRQQAEAALLAWARERADVAKDELYQQSKVAGDPEVRERCYSVLRNLVADDYQRDGVGFIGIRMNPMTEIVNVAGEQEPRFAIRVLQVEPGTPAQANGLVAGDLLIGVNDTYWRREHTSEVVSEKIKSFKAGTQVTVKLVRDGKIVAVPMVLARRPAAADVLLFGMGAQITPEAAAAAENTAKDAYFRRWLAERKSRE